MLSCFSNLDACDGGYLDIAWQDLLSMGIVSDKCFPYKAKGTACPSVCTDGSPLSPQKLQRVYSVYVPFNNPQNVETIQADILANGPVESAFWVFSDFMHYTTGVYQRLPGSSFEGGHAIKIIGWGTDQKTSLPFWLVANSWGTTWGESGTFRILRGVNECGIEDSIAAGNPA
jgi:cathepsin B